MIGQHRKIMIYHSSTNTANLLNGRKAILSFISIEREAIIGGRLNEVFFMNITGLLAGSFILAVSKLVAIL